MLRGVEQCNSGALRLTLLDCGTQAFQAAVQATNVHCMGEKAGRHQAPVLPLLLSAEPARLPDNTSVPPPVVPQVWAEATGCHHVKLSAALLC